MAKRIANVVSILILAALFVFPSRYLCKLSDEIVNVSENTVDAVHRGDWEMAQNNVQWMNARYRESKDILQLFLHHQSVEQLDSDLRAALQLVRTRDKAQTLMELEFIITTAKHMKCIEGFSWSTLL
ncbi:MAG TPA: DUF4363 family protein [Feifaniaceae bacterium]|nr:DUF4363 family protein [Feifaniaceae bacterium]